MQRQGEGTTHALMRRYILNPVMLALVVALALRGSYTWTNGRLNLFIIPILGGVLLFVTGISIAVTCEMLMSEGGRDMMMYRRAIAAVKRRTDLTAEQKAATLEDLEGGRVVSAIFMWVGLVASLFSGLWFLMGAGHPDLGAGLIDAGVSTIATLAVLFFYALRQEETADPVQRMEEVSNAAMVRLVETAAAQLAGVATTADGNALLAPLLLRSLGGDMRARYAPVMALLNPPKPEVDYWNMAQVYEYAGARGDETRKRKVRRKLDTVEHECSQDPDGGRLVPIAIAMPLLASMHDEWVRWGEGAIKLG